MPGQKLVKCLILTGFAKPGRQQQQRAEVVFRFSALLDKPMPLARIHSRSASVESPNSTLSLSSQTEPHGGAGSAHGPMNSRCQASASGSSSSIANCAARPFATGQGH
jgi:hypothetical protein